MRKSATIIIAVAAILSIASVAILWQQGIIGKTEPPKAEETVTVEKKTETESTGVKEAKVIYLFDYEGKETDAAFGPSLIDEAEALHKTYKKVETQEWVRYLFASYASPYETADDRYPEAKVDGTCIESFTAWAMTVQHDLNYDILGEPAEGIEKISWGDTRLEKMFDDIVKKMSKDIDYQLECYERWCEFLYEDADISIESGTKVSLAGMRRYEEGAPIHLHQCSVERNGTWVVFKYDNKTAYLRLDCGGQPGKVVVKKKTTTSKKETKEEPGTPGETPSDEPGTPGKPDNPSYNRKPKSDPTRPSETCDNPEDAPDYPGNVPETSAPAEETVSETSAPAKETEKDPGGNPISYPGSDIPAYVPGNAGSDGDLVSGDTDTP